MIGRMALHPKNAKIVSTMLGFEDHGIMTCYLYLDYDGSGQGFGGYALGGEFGIEFIKKILKTLEVDKWEDLAGTHCRAEAGHDKVHRIGHILKDQWFDPKDIVPEHEKK